MVDEVAGGGVVDLVTMGCAWTLDLTALDARRADETRDRWARCVDLAIDPGTIRLDEEPTTLRVGLGDLPATEAAGSGVVGSVVTASDPERLPYVLSREITRLGLTRLRGRASLLHAAALTDADGRAVVLVAPSGGGKSTATRVLAVSYTHLTLPTNREV